VATHAATGSRLVIRAFRDAGFGRGESCEAQARALDPSLPRVDVGVLEQRRLAPAPDFELGLVVAVVPDAAGVLLRGRALAFGGDGRRCLAVTFTTSTQGAAADTVLAERLGLIVESTFARMRLRSIDQRVRGPRR
jgi:hypothetical protein